MNFAEAFEDLRRLGKDQPEMTEAAIKAIRSINLHPQRSWTSEEDALEILGDMSTMLADIPNAIDQSLTKEIKRFGLPQFGKAMDPAGGDRIKAHLAYLIYSATYCRYIFDLCDTLESRYGITDLEQRHRMAEEAAYKIRLNHDGNVDAYFNKLEKTVPAFRKASEAFAKVGNLPEAPEGFMVYRSKKHPHILVYSRTEEKKPRP